MKRAGPYLDLETMIIRAILAGISAGVAFAAVLLMAIGIDKLVHILP
jgi:hypothetical protein